MFKKQLQIITLMAILLVGGVMTSHAQDNSELETPTFDTSSESNNTREGGGDDLPDTILWDFDGGRVSDDEDDVDVPDCIIWDIDGASGWLS